MESQFHVDRGHSVAGQEGLGDSPALDPNRAGEPWQLVSEVERLLGPDSEPDPLFFVESWSLGVPAAVENLERRRHDQAERERKGHTFDNFSNPRAQAFVQERELYAEFLSSARAAANSWFRGAQSSPRSPVEPSAFAYDVDSQEWGSSADRRDMSDAASRPMRQDRARQLLGVTATSTRRQIKAAYRNMVSKWHPDHLECRTEEMRHFATEKMVAINAAYRMLRELDGVVVEQKREESSRDIDAQRNR